MVAVEAHGDAIANVVYRSDEGDVAERLVSADDATRLEVADARRWTFDADGLAFKLASEARRIELAHLFDPYTAVQAATIDPLPHQIEAVYGRLLPAQPCNFLLADDPGAGKTIMSGLYIRELMLRGALERCLVIAPGSLVEQWQEELAEKFGLRFAILSRGMIEAALSGNPFVEQPLLIARLDQLARSDDLRAKLAASEWDLVIMDEAHKCSAHLYGEETKRTLRFTLAELARDRSHNLLLLTATPHNGKNEDFLLFLSLLDPDRFAGRLRNGAKVPDVSDVMRRYVKEKLLTFDGKKLFPERIATTVNYDLNPAEWRLYEAVTEYVQEGMNRAKAMEDGGQRARGLAIGFALAALQRRLASSPEAIHHSLRRRRERLAAKLAEAERLGQLEAQRQLGTRLDDPDGFDPDDFDDDEFERLEDEAIEQALLVESIPELEAEIVELRRLELMSDELRRSDDDRKWLELRSILSSEEFRGPDAAQKLIVFSEHRDTLNYLEAKVRTTLGHPDAVVTIHGGMRREDRRRAQDRFRTDAAVKVLIATDAAGEGVNLQRANLMVNYDLPWNPNRIEQRFGRIHRIGQTRPCHLWNLVAHQTREGRVFERLFAKIEQQRGVYGDQIYDVLGDAEVNRSLQELLVEAIRYGADPEVKARHDEVVDAEIGERLKSVLAERALAADVLDADSIQEIKARMEEALARRLSPGFVGAFFDAALDDLGGRMAAREPGRFEITRVPASVRSRDREVAAGGAILPTYERVTFDKARVSEPEGAPRAELVSPGHPLLHGVIGATLDRHGATLSAGTTFVDEDDLGDTPRVLVALEHRVTDGRMEAGARRVVSSRFQFVEITESGDVRNPGPEPYLGYATAPDDVGPIRDQVDLAWTRDGIDQVARSWATANLATPHHAEVAEVTAARIARIQRAVEQRLDAEIRYWDARAAELKQRELQGKKGRLNSGRARQRADDLEARKARRLHELAIEADLVNHAPTVVAAALVIPRGLLDRLTGAPAQPFDPDVAAETDRIAVAAAMEAERALGRIPVEQVHNNPGFDILSTDPETGTAYFIEVKGHRPATTEIKVRAPQVVKAQQNPERFRLVVVAVPDDGRNPVVRYFVRPFDGYDLHFAQAYVPLAVAQLAPHAVEPQ